MAMAGILAIRTATFFASSMSLSAGTTRLTRPMRKASVASTRSPRRSSSLVLLILSTHGMIRREGLSKIRSPARRIGPCPRPLCSRSSWRGRNRRQGNSRVHRHEKPAIASANAKPGLVAILGVVAPVLHGCAWLFPRRNVEAGTKRLAGAGDELRGRRVRGERAAGREAPARLDPLGPSQGGPLLLRPAQP